MKAYTVKYRMRAYTEEKEISVLAHSKYDAYDKATYEAIPALEGCCPYSSWVYSVTYNNGNYRRFNNCEGLAY